MDLKKKITALSTVIMVGLGSAFAIPSVKAATNDVQSIQEQRSGIQTGINQANSEISQVQDQLTQITPQVNRVDQAIKDNSNIIIQTENKIKASEEEVNRLEQEVAGIKDRIAERNDILKKRAVSYQANGTDIRYLDVLLGASSFSDLVERISAIAEIVQADSDLLKQHEDDKKLVEKKQSEVEKKLADLKSMKTELEGMQTQIMEQKSRNDVLKAALIKEEQAKQSQKAGLQQQDASLAAEQLKLEQAAQSQTMGGNSAITLPTGISSSAASAINIVTKAGYRYIGNSVYVFGGGRTPSDIQNGRFDCSAFVHWAFAQAGINVGSSTDTLINDGVQIPFSQIRPGDLVFFNTYKTDGHVGIYIGGGQFIGSQSSTGVAIVNLSNPYWSKAFNGRVVRVINS